jgi:ribosomal-protein-alanine N-acetyltransferase
MGCSEGKVLSKGTPPIQPSDSRVELRKIGPSDLEEVMRIEKTSFPTPWSTRFFLEELRAPCAHSLLATVNNRVVGYVLYWLLPGELDVHNLAVDRDYRRQGIGRSLLQAVIAEAKDRGLERVTLEVRKSNAAAQNLYYNLGFVVQGVRVGYYSDNGEDAFVMALALNRTVV